MQLPSVVGDPGYGANARVKTMVTARSCLCVVLAPSIELALFGRAAAPSVAIANKVYEDRVGDDFLGFYDWLRDPFGRIVGVRETFGVGFESLIDLIPDRDYLIKTAEPPRVEIFFSASREFDPSESADQDFLMNRLLVSQEGEVTLTFGVDAELADQIVAIGSSPSHSPSERSDP